MADRLAQRRTDGGDGYRLRHGGGVRLPPGDGLGRHRLLVVADASGGDQGGADPLVRLALPVDVERLAELGLAPAPPELEVHWEDAAGERGDVAARLVTRLDELVLRDGPAPPSWTAAPGVGERISAALLDGVRRRGLGLLGNLPAARRLQQRVQFCRRHLGPAWPDLADEALLDDVERWLAPYLAGARRARDLAGIDCRLAWWQLLGAQQQRALGRLAPDTVRIPTGRTVAIDYGAETPTLSVKLQELFGAADLPRVADGVVRLRIELLSPAGRPVAVTDDLGRFWSSGYPAVRAELRGRYPKHPWPTDPLAAVPTAATSRSATRAGQAGPPGATRPRR
jgi:ATP-dependent helicase HrpB